LGSSEGDGGRSFSQECETNREMSFTTLNGLWLGCCFTFGLLGHGIGVAEAFVPNFHQGPHGKVFLENIVQGVDYERFKFKDGRDMEVYENLNFVNYDWHSPGDPTSLKK